VWLTDIAFVGTVTSTTNKTQKQKLDRVPGRENPPNPSGASEGDLFTHSRKFTPRGVRTPDLWDATRVLQLVGLAFLGLMSYSENNLNLYVCNFFVISLVLPFFVWKK